jgi:hypothetical protein
MTPTVAPNTARASTLDADVAASTKSPAFTLASSGPSVVRT